MISEENRSKVETTAKWTAGSGWLIIAVAVVLAVLWLLEIIY